MNKRELIRLAFSGDGPKEGYYLSDDFQWSDELGNPPMDRASWMAMGQPLQAALPDLAIVLPVAGPPTSPSRDPVRWTCWPPRL